jgi:signal transduction histidine kinase/integral membrane sensor domain MASE1
MSTLTFPSANSRTPALGSLLAGPAFTAALYFLGAEAAFLIGTLSDRIFAPFWPPNIVLFCALLLAPPRLWWLYLLATFPAHVVAELGVGMPMPQLLVAFATNCAVALVNAAATRGLLGPLPWFDSLSKALLYVAITAVASPALVALGGAFVPILGGGSVYNYWTFWVQWCLSNTVSILALGPVVLTWLSDRNRPAAHLSSGAIVEGALLSAGLFLVCAFAFESGKGAVADGLLPAILYLPLPLILWAAIRFGARGASVAILVVAVALLWRTLNGPNPFSADTPEESVFAIQAFLIGVSIPVLLLGTAIEETRRAEQAVRKSEESMSFAAIAADLCLWHFNYRSDQFWITDHGRRMFDLALDAPVTKQSIIDAIHPHDQPAARSAIRSVALSDRLIDTEFRIIRRDGSIRWVRARARADRNARGEKIKISGTFADITTQKAAESELAQQRRDLAHLMRVSMLGELSGSFAHELTQPLTAILSNAQAAKLIMANASPDFAEVAAALDDIISEDDRAGKVIHHMRGMLKKGEAKFEPINVNDLVGSTLRLLNNELIARRVTCDCNLTKELPPTSGDPVQLQQVLLNLIMNAVEAMHGVSSSRRIITIRTRTLGQGKVSIDISDRGTGVAPTHEHQIFQPFFTTKERGLGLGLAICSSIMKLHGGTLDLENNPDEGATATLVIPGEDVHLVS